MLRKTCWPVLTFRLLFQHLRTWFWTIHNKDGLQYQCQFGLEVLLTCLCSRCLHAQYLIHFLTGRQVDTHILNCKRQSCS